MYLEQLIQDGKLLGQRNAAEATAKGGLFDNSTLELYDEQIIPIAKQIFEKRKIYIRRVTTYFSFLLSKYFWQ